jgi:hypothetical protein
MLSTKNLGMKLKIEPKWSKLFVVSIGVMLLLTGFSKIVAAFGKTNVLSEVDPIFGISFRQLFLFSGALEVLIAEICLLSKRLEICLKLVLWLSLAFLVYRLGLWWMDWKQPCQCLGSLTDSLRISPNLADLIAKCLLAYMLLGDCVALWFQRKKQTIRIQDNVSRLCKS